jgi:hypothetical protein
MDKSELLVYYEVNYMSTNKKVNYMSIENELHVH